MLRLLEGRQQKISEGARPIGWKLGFGAPAALQRLGTSAPLIGFVTDATVVSSGVAVTIEGWTRPIIEPEVAVYMATDLEGGSDRDAVRASIGSLGPAIELADVDLDNLEIEPIMAGNVFHRGVVLGASDPGRAGGRLENLTARVMGDGADLATTSDLEALPGEMLSNVGSLADLLNAAGERLRAGDVIITGSVIPPVSATSVSELTFELIPFAPISVRFEYNSGSRTGSGLGRFQEDQRNLTIGPRLVFGIAGVGRHHSRPP